MFKEMQKYKSWEKFCEWLKNKFHQTGLFHEHEKFIEFRKEKDINEFAIHRISDIYPKEMVLNIMPLFFDENEIYIEIHHYASDAFQTKVYKRNNKKLFIDFIADFGGQTRQKALKPACIKAFEILNEK